jgi:hypothetical protein
MSRRRQVLGLLSELERRKLGDAASRRGQIEARRARIEAERRDLVENRSAARDAQTIESLPHLASFQRAVAARISRCEADDDALRTELEAVEEEMLVHWRWSKTLRTVAGRPS